MSGIERSLGEPPAPQSVSDLEVVRERNRSLVNEFLERWHPLGSVPGWKACFSARYGDYLVAVVVLGRPASTHNDDGGTLSITRFCRRDDRPDNTGSWLIARAREWAFLEGYDSVLAHAGVAGNYGTVYEAAGFDLDRTSQSRADDWQRREGRESYGEYDRKTWVYQLRNSRSVDTATDQSPEADQHE